MDLKWFLESYKSITITLIKNIEEDEDFLELFTQRQDIINNIKKLNFEQSEFDLLFANLGIFNLEEKLKSTINTEKIKVKKKINFIKVTREAREKYENAQFKPTFFNKTI